jgi:hypothetical protein
MKKMLASIVGSSFFVSFDFIGTYWQCLASRQASEGFSLQTPLGIVSSNCTIQGSSPATSHFSAVMLDAFRDILDSLIAWIHDYFRKKANQDVDDTTPIIRQACWIAGRCRARFRRWISWLPVVPAFLNASLGEGSALSSK